MEKVELYFYVIDMINSYHCSFELCMLFFFSGLAICGHNCLLTAEWMSASKIVCRVGQAKNDKGDIIVTTKSGGKGTSTVSFKLLKPEKIGIYLLSCYSEDENKNGFSFKI